jgi:hypothetical protein
LQERSGRTSKILPDARSLRRASGFFSAGRFNRKRTAHPVDYVRSNSGFPKAEDSYD